MFEFGEVVEGFDVRVLNEREVRAGAGILFLFAIVSFMNSWLLGDFGPTRIFVVAFLVDFLIRVVLNPRYSPSLVVGRFMVRNQTPEFVAAAPKRFAWSFGLLLSLSIFFLLVVQNRIGPLNLVICVACLTFLFFESVFGICIACKVYNLFHKEPASLCPGGVCEVQPRREIQRIRVSQIVVLAFFLAFLFWMATKSRLHGFADNATHAVASDATVPRLAAPPSDPDSASDGTCTPPDWAVKMGHGEMWKKHHGCK